MGNKWIFLSETLICRKVRTKPSEKKDFRNLFAFGISVDVSASHRHPPETPPSFATEPTRPESASRKCALHLTTAVRCATVQPAHVAALWLRSLAGRTTAWSVCGERDLQTAGLQFARRGLQVGQTTLNHSGQTLNWNAHCTVRDSRRRHSILMTNTYSSWGLSLQNCGYVLTDLWTSDFAHMDNWRQTYCMIFFFFMFMIYLQLHLHLKKKQKKKTTLHVQKIFFLLDWIDQSNSTLNHFLKGRITQKWSVTPKQCRPARWTQAFYWNRHSS